MRIIIASACENHVADAPDDKTYTSSDAIACSSSDSVADHRRSTGNSFGMEDRSCWHERRVVKEKETVAGLKENLLWRNAKDTKILHNIWEKAQCQLWTSLGSNIFSICLRISLCSFICVCFYFRGCVVATDGRRNDVPLDIVCLVWSWRLRHKNVQLPLPDKLLSVDEYVLFTWWTETQQGRTMFRGFVQMLHSRNEGNDTVGVGRRTLSVSRKSKKRGKADFEEKHAIDFTISDTSVILPAGRQR